MPYQDVLFKNKPQIRGGRECEERWEMVRPHLPSRGVLLDIGSDVGYFAVRAALEHANLSVISLEAYEESALTQKEVLASHRLTKVCLLQGAFSSIVARSWYRSSPDWLDVILLLSVIHWMDDPQRVVSTLSRMSSTLIAEVVDPSDVGACGQKKIKEMGDPLEWLRRVTGRNCELIGRCKRHTSRIPSHLIKVSGKPEIGRIGRNRNFYTEAQNEHMLSTASDTALRVQLSSLMHLGRLLWPAPSTLLDAAFARRVSSTELPDPFTRNIGWSPSGFTVCKTGLDDSSIRRLSWRVGGTQELPHSVQRSCDRGASRKMLKRILSLWAHGVTVWVNSDCVRDLPPSPIRAFKRCLRRILPVKARMIIKKLIGKK
jgi:hypothetical protein